MRLDRGARPLGTVLSAGPAGRLSVAAQEVDGLVTASAGNVAVALWGELYEDGSAVTDASLNEALQVIAAFRRHGAGLARHVKGKHVFLLYDAAEDLFIAARDRVGIIPLFYRSNGRTLDFAVDAGAFAVGGDGAPGVNVDLAVSYLAHTPMRLEETFLQGVSRLPPGHQLVEDRGARTVARHWLPPPVGAGAQWVTEAELPRFGELLDAAVARPLVRGRGGIFLSGGLDSVSVAAAAVDHTQRHGLEPLVALSLLFPHGVNEETTQRGVANGLGLELVALEFDDAVGPGGLLQAGLDLSQGLAAPLQNVWTPAYDALTAVGREHGIENVLTGGGGDEWLTVTPLIAADYLQRGEFGALFAYLGVLSRSLNLQRRHLWRNVLWSNGARPLLHEFLGRARRSLLPGQVDERRRRALAARLAALPDWLAPAGPVRELLHARLEGRYAGSVVPAQRGPGGRYFQEMTVTLDHPLFALDVEEIFADGQRNRTPHWDIYWDADLIEFLYRVPPALLNQGGRSKGLVRADVARRFPDFGFDTQRKLLSRDFFIERFYSELGRAWPALGGLEALSDLGLVDRMRVGRAIDEALNVRDSSFVDKIWRLISLEAWARARV